MNIAGYVSMVRLDRLWREEVLQADIYNRLITLTRRFPVDKAEKIKEHNIEIYTFDTLDIPTMWWDVRLFWLHEENGNKILSVIR